VLTARNCRSTCTTIVEQPDSKTGALFSVLRHTDLHRFRSTTPAVGSLLNGEGRAAGTTNGTAPLNHTSAERSTSRDVTCSHEEGASPSCDDFGVSASRGGSDGVVGVLSVNTLAEPRPDQIWVKPGGGVAEVVGTAVPGRPYDEQQLVGDGLGVFARRQRKCAPVQPGQQLLGNPSHASSQTAEARGSVEGRRWPWTGWQYAQLYM
jgi:hypothetical protein